MSLALPRVLTTLDAELTVLDNRPPSCIPTSSTPTPPEAHGALRDADPRNKAEAYQYHILIGFGYRTNLQALRQLLGLSVRYLGTMGSEAKIWERNSLGF